MIPAYNPFEEIFSKLDSIEKVLHELAKGNQIQTQSQEELPDTIKVKEAAQEINYRPSYLYELVSKESIPYFRVNSGAIRFSRKELREWMKAGRPNIMQETIENLSTKASKKRKP